ncbi:Methyltransferase domain-containing protein [Streptomyces sp. 1222.5]|uniref:class I SAM-dependent methyltransferase n=1 Tax=unclassified Streptomyces TaxID=2593676 RepID=UPI000894EB69|nr:MULTISPECIES: class I SAM-dependent methyltransferase [unclassified Streptomyces]PKW00397.1 methyltransferase family protein [Streptomyces sp. 5112.2]SED87000.1 Methyltransferase domain-containing protein [Streptomyces sp. 1222.5]
MNQHQATQVDEERYRPVLANQRSSKTLRAIYQEVYQEEYPDEVEPFGFVTLSDLRACARFLGPHEVTRLVDVGCGRGGPGLWVARELGASLAGVDIVAEAVEEARRLATTFHRAPEAEFHAAGATDTKLPGQSFDGAMSIDALWMVLNKAAAFEELARLLRPGSPLVFTTWAPPHLDYAWFLEPAGFQDIETVEVTGSPERQLAVYERILAERATIAREMGDAAAQVLVDEATEAPLLLGTVPRVMVRAVRAR